MRSFIVGQRVTVLRAAHLPKEVSQGDGIIERITRQASNGEPLYWVSGFPCARDARVLRIVTE